MKTLLALLITTTSFAQLDAHMRIGYSTKTVDVFIAPGLGYTFQGERETGIRIETDLIINTKQNASADAGINFGIKYKGFEFGHGLYYMAYSTDKYDIDKNHFAPNLFVKYGFKQWFVKAQYLEQFKIGFGVKGIL